MQLKHLLAALAVTSIWGFNFVVIKVGLNDFPPFLFIAIRFLIVLFPLIFFIPKPDVSMSLIFKIGLFFAAGQFAFLFLGIYIGMPAGLSSIILQTQAFFTVLLAAVFYGERPHLGQVIGILVAFLGVALIGAQMHVESLDASASKAAPMLIGFGCIIASAISFAYGNLLIKHCGSKNMLHLMVWTGLVPPLPMLVLSLMFEGKDKIVYSLTHCSWRGIAAVTFTAWISTLVGATLWGKLFRLYPASIIAPFSLLIPVFGMLSASFFLGENFKDEVLFASSIVIAGLAINQLSPGLLSSKKKPS